MDVQEARISSTVIYRGRIHSCFFGQSGTSLFKTASTRFSYMCSMPCAQSTTLYENNQGCIKIACNEKVSARTKHIDVRHHHLRDLQFREVMNLKYCASDQMRADIMTKPLTRDKLLNISNQIGLCTDN